MLWSTDSRCMGFSGYNLKALEYKLSNCALTGFIVLLHVESSWTRIKPVSWLEGGFLSCTTKKVPSFKKIS